MSILISFVLVAQMLSAIGVIVLVLLQHGKGADMGAAFGSGASGSLFGATGSANFLSRITAGMATVFFVCTLALSYLGSRGTTAPKSLMEQGPPAAPATSVIPGVSGGSVLAPITGAVPASKDAPVSKGGPTGEIPK